MNERARRVESGDEPRPAASTRRDARDARDACRSLPDSPTGHCATCSDEMIVARVVEIFGDSVARVCVGDGPGAELTEISLALVTAEVGDSVLVHAGEALSVL